MERYCVHGKYLCTEYWYCVPVYLEVEDAGILSFPEALSMWDDSSQNFLVQGQRGDGGKQPAVTWMTNRKRTGLRHLPLNS